MGHPMVVAVAVRLQFTPRKEPPDLLDLPWAVPLEDWQHPRLVRMAKGTFRGLSYGQPGLADHHCPGFIAQGPGADYPSLASAAEQIHQLRTGR